MVKNKKFMCDIGQVRFREKVIGYIEKGSWDWSDVKLEKTDVEAEQMPTAPVLMPMQKSGTISLIFNLIQPDYKNLHLATGDILVDTSDVYTGWKAPTSLIGLRDKCEIDLAGGQTVRMSNATLISNLGGRLTLTETSKLECQLTANMPKNGGVPYEVFDVQEDPGE